MSPLSSCCSEMNGPKRCCCAGWVLIQVMLGISHRNYVQTAQKPLPLQSLLAAFWDVLCRAKVVTVTLQNQTKIVLSARCICTISICRATSQHIIKVHHIFFVMWHPTYINPIMFRPNIDKIVNALTIKIIFAVTSMCLCGNFTSPVCRR